MWSVAHCDGNAPVAYEQTLLQLGLQVEVTHKEQGC